MNPNRLSEHEGLIFTVARQYLPFAGAANDMDDLMQAGRIGVMMAERTYKPEKGAFSTWALYYIRNEIRRMVNSQRVQSISLDAPLTEDGGTLAELLPDPEADTAAPFESDDFCSVVVSRVDALKNDMERLAVHLCKLEGLTAEDAALLLGVDVSCVRRSIYTAFQKLRRDHILRELWYYQAD